MEVAVDTGLVFPLVSVVEVLVNVAVLLFFAEDEDRGGGVAAVGEGLEVGRSEGGLVVVLDAPVVEGRMGREYVRRAGLVVEVSLGGAGTRMCGDIVPAPAPPAAFGPWPVVMEGAGVRGGGGEEVTGVTVGTGESRSMGLGVSRGGVGVVGAEEEESATVDV